MQYFTINMDAIRWASAWAANRKEKRVKIAFSFFNVLLKQSTAVKPAFFQSVRQKEERRDGEGGILEKGGWKGGEMEGLLTCTCLQSLRIHFTIHLLCLYCHGWGQSDQTPIRFLILPPPASPPSCLRYPLSLSPPTPFFSYDTLAEGEERQFTILPKWGNVSKGTNIMSSWRYSTDQKWHTNTHTHWPLYTHWLAQIHTHIHTYTHFS